MVTHWLSIREKHFGPPCAFSRVFPLFPLSPVTLSPSPVPCLTSYVPCLTSLFLVYRPLFPVSRLGYFFRALCSLSHVSVTCFPLSVPCLTSLLLVSRPLFPVSRLCYLFHVLCTLSSMDLSPVSVPNPYQLSHCPLFYGSIPLFLFLRFRGEGHSLAGEGVGPNSDEGTDTDS